MSTERPKLRAYTLCRYPSDVAKVVERTELKAESDSAALCSVADLIAEVGADKTWKRAWLRSEDNMNYVYDSEANV